MTLKKKILQLEKDLAICRKKVEKLHQENTELKKEILRRDPENPIKDRGTDIKGL